MGYVLPGLTAPGSLRMFNCMLIGTSNSSHLGEYHMKSSDRQFSVCVCECVGEGGSAIHPNTHTLSIFGTLPRLHSPYETTMAAS